MPDQPIADGADDILSPLGAAIIRQAGDAAYQRLVITGPAPAAAPKALEGVKPEQILARPVKHPDDAQAALAGLWLWHDDLDGCHRIAQEIVSPTGSFWHAIMHRREGDFSNAKYWYARCDSHHVLRMIGAVASSFAGEHASDRLVAHALSGGWNAGGFVDLVQAIHGKPADPRHALAVRLQQIEWQALFSYCLTEAVDADRAGLDDWDRRVSGSSGG